MNWTQDLRFAFRMIRKNPWFSAAIVVTLALGMGVNTTVFSLVNGVLYKPLPFPGGERLVMVGADNVSRSRDFVNMSYADFRDYRQEAKSFERLEAFAGEAMTLSERGNPRICTGACGSNRRGRSCTAAGVILVSRGIADRSKRCFQIFRPYSAG